MRCVVAALLLGACQAQFVMRFSASSPEDGPGSDDRFFPSFFGPRVEQPRPPQPNAREAFGPGPGFPFSPLMSMFSRAGPLAPPESMTRMAPPPPMAQPPMAQKFQLFFIDDDDSVIRLVAPTALPSQSQSFFSFLPQAFMLMRGGAAAGSMMPSEEAEGPMPPCMACADDLEKFCQEELEAHPDEMLQSSFALQMCLMRREDAISSQCLQAISVDENLVTMCHADIDAHCQGVAPGNSKIHTCLKEHKADLTDQCGRQVTRAAERLGGSMALAREESTRNPVVTPMRQRQQMQQQQQQFGRQPPRPQGPQQQLRGPAAQPPLEDGVAALDNEMNSMIRAMDMLFAPPAEQQQMQQQQQFGRQPPRPRGPQQQLRGPAAAPAKEEEEATAVEKPATEEPVEEAKETAKEADAVPMVLEEEEALAEATVEAKVEETKASDAAAVAPLKGVAQIAKIAAEMKAKRNDKDAAKPTAREAVAASAPTAAAPMAEGAQEQQSIIKYALGNERVQKMVSLTAAAAGVVSLLVLGSVTHRMSQNARARREREAFRRSYAPGML